MENEEYQDTTDNTQNSNGLDNSDNSHCYRDCGRSSFDMRNHDTCMWCRDVQQICISIKCEIPGPNIPEKTNECSNNTYQSDALEQDQVKLSSGKLYNCDVCSYTTTRTNNLWSHKRKHKEKLYKCDVCSYRTAWSGHFAVHKRKHTNKCDMCSYSTVWPGALAVHKRIHTGEKPYQCSECSYSTTTSDALAKHRTQYTGLKTVHM